MAINASGEQTESHMVKFNRKFCVSSNFRCGRKQYLSEKRGSFVFACTPTNKEYK